MRRRHVRSRATRGWRLQFDGDVAVDVGGYVARGSAPHKRLDFLPIGETDHGFVESHGHKIRLEGVEGDAGMMP